MIAPPILLITFLLGLAVGSFLNVVIDRIPAGGSIFGRSYCDHCEKQLRWFELIPLLSFLIQRAKCLRCSQELSWQYPIVELTSSLFFVAIAFSFGISDPLLFVLVAGLLVLFVIDFKNMILPDVITLPLIVVAALRILLLPSPVLPVIISSLILSAFFLFIIIITKGRGMGGGDVKLAVLIGLISGWPGILVSVFIAFVFGGMVASVLLLLRRKRFGQVLPFGPFLIFGTLTAIFFGSKITSWYLEQFVF